MTAILEFRDVCKNFPVKSGFFHSRPSGWVRAVDNVSFAIEEGTTVGLIGESGCGKTTVTKLALGLEDTTEGEILYYGQPISTLDKRGRIEFHTNVQAVFQDPFSSLNPRIRVGNLIAEPIRINMPMNRSDRDARIAEVLSQVGLWPGAANLFPHEFSGGQRQRIAIARALSLRPKLVILDEPVSALDVSIQGQILNLLTDLKSRFGLSYLLISHNLASIRYMCDQITVMYLGGVVEAGAAHDVFMRMAHPYTNALFSAALPPNPDVVREEVALQGEIPNALNVPSGCRFHPRCPRAFAQCASTRPKLRAIGERHVSACLLCDVNP